MLVDGDVVLVVEAIKIIINLSGNSENTGVLNRAMICKSAFLYLYYVY